VTGLSKATLEELVVDAVFRTVEKEIVSAIRKSGLIEKVVKEHLTEDNIKDLMMDLLDYDQDDQMKDLIREVLVNELKKVIRDKFSD
jgi:hypothetical protein